MTLQNRAFDAGSDLRGATYHPAANGRVITLDPPYELPEGMDLRGIAGVVLKRTQNAQTAAYIRSLDDSGIAALRRAKAEFSGGKLVQKIEGPRACPMPPSPLAEEITEIASAFARLTRTDNVNLHMAYSNPREFHIDGTGFHPNWRLTYAFEGAQTLWHRGIKTDSMPVKTVPGMGFPLLPKDQIGEEGKDFFPSEGALLFMTFSPNGLFHRAPNGDDSKRIVMTLDAHAPRRPDCSRSCPFPCR